MFTVYYSTGIRIQQRWIFAIMGFLALFNAYAMRICLSIAITEMVVPLNITEEFIDDTCSELANKQLSNVTTAHGSGIYDWSEYTQVREPAIVYTFSYDSINKS